MGDLERYEDPNDPGNSAAHHTGEPCVEGCGRPAGTRWSPLWCFECNVERMRRIDTSLRDTLATLERMRQGLERKEARRG